jgi:hypothetical protein
MMQFPQAGKPAMPKKKAKKGGISGAIGDLLDRVRSAGRPSVADSTPGAPKPKGQAFDEFAQRFEGNRAQNPKRGVREAEEAMNDQASEIQRGKQFTRGYNPKTRTVDGKKIPDVPFKRRLVK